MRCRRTRRAKMPGSHPDSCFTRTLLSVLFAVLAMICTSLLRAESTDTVSQQITVIQEKLETLDASDQTLADQRQLYTEALRVLRAALATEQSTREYQDTISQAAAQLARLDKRINAARLAESSVKGLADKVPLARLEQVLSDHREDLEVLRAREAVLIRTRNDLSSRERLVHEELMALQAQLQYQAEPEQTPQLKRVSSVDQAAMSKAIDLQRRALVEKLAVEEQTLPTRLELVEKELELISLQRQQAETLVNGLLNLDNIKAINDAAEMVRSASERRLALASDAPFLRDLADQNVGMAEEFLKLTSRAEEMEQLLARARGKLEELRREFLNSNQQIAISALRPSLGPLLKESYLALLEADASESRIEDAVQLTGQARLRSVVVARDLASEPRHRESVYQQLERLDFSDEAQRKLTNKEAEQLLADYSMTLAELNDLYERVSDGLLSLDQIWRERIELRTQYRKLLQSNLLWLRSDAPLSIADLMRWPGELVALFGVVDWAAFREQMAEFSLIHALLLLALFALSGLQRRIKSRVSHELALSSLRQAGWERYSYPMTIRALGAQLFGALPVPLALVAVALYLRISGDSAFVDGLINACYTAAVQVYLLMLFRAMLGENGFARDHLRWRPEPSRKLQAVISTMLYVLVPMLFLTSLLGYLTPFIPNSQAYRIMSIVVAAVALWLFYRALQAADGIHDNIFFNQRYASLERSGAWLLRLLLIAQPLVLLIDLIGYRFTAEVLQLCVFLSLVLLVATRILIDTAMLGVAIGRRSTTGQAEQVSDQLADQDPRFDLEKMNQSVVMLLHVIMVASAVSLALWIWQPFIEALSVLDTVELWTTSSEVDGEQVSNIVSLFDLGAAALVLAGAVVLSRGLPALLGVILFHVVTQKGALYAIQTVLKYSLVALGFFLSLQVLGFGWSRLQWMAAGLSVGLGFGLQEIFANFFAGLIMLFERPVRLGDVVTLGEYSGTIHRIRMRATTLLDFDNREVIIPNKMFVTERLINWTLSSGVVRLSFVVGISYDADVHLARQTLLTLLAADERVLSDPAPNVVFFEFGDSALNLRCYCHVSDTSLRLDVQNDMHLRILAEFRRLGIEIAYPQMDLHLRSVDEAAHLKPVPGS